MKANPALVGVTVDQRGASRPVGVACDMGGWNTGAYPEVAFASDNSLRFKF